MFIVLSCSQNGILADEDYRELGITDTDDVSKLTSSIRDLHASLPPANTQYKLPNTVAEWLSSLQLSNYEENFTKNGFGCMDRVRKMWEVELSMVLEITKLGHKKRLLTSLGDRPIEPLTLNTVDTKELSVELSKLVSSFLDILFYLMLNSC